MRGKRTSLSGAGRDTLTKLERRARRVASVVRRRAGVTRPRSAAKSARTGPAARGPLSYHAGLLPRRQDRVVVVLADDTVRIDLLRQYVAGLPGDRITVLGRADGIPGLAGILETATADTPRDDVEWFVRNGPVDIVIDLRSPSAEPRRARWARLFLYLRPKGVWIVPRQSLRGDVRQTERSWLVALAERTAKGDAPTTRNHDAEAMRSVEGVTARAGILVIEKRLTHVVKLRDDEIMTVLPSRDPDIEVRELQVLPAQLFRSQARVVSHESTKPVTGLETDISVPQMSLRHYRGPIVFAGNTLMYAKNSVLADSFRFYHASEDKDASPLANPRLYNFDTRLARVKPGRAPMESLVGDFYQVDPQFTGHFGHIMTEVIPRLWGWDVAKAQLPELKAMLWIRPRTPEEIEAGTDPRSALHLTLLRAYGIADEDIVRVERPAYVNSLVSATMMWHNWRPYFVHPAIRDVWQRLSDAVLDPDAQVYERIFVSRSAGLRKRRCLNNDEVEAFFVAQGFTVVYPEKMTLGQQAAVFANAEVIAGYGGSALFNLMYAQRVRTIIILNQEEYTARNEHLYTSVLSCDVHYFWSTPDVPHPEGGWTIDAFLSDWSFDFARNEAALRKVLDAL